MIPPDFSHRSFKQTRTVGFILGIFCIGFSAAIIVPMLVSLWYQDHQFTHFLIVFLSTFIIGAVLYLSRCDQHHDLKVRDGYLLVTVFWIGVSLLAALPLKLSLHISYVDALFEAVSGFTTTGSTVILDIEALPPSILFYRQFLQWIGGMGLIVLAIAVLPMLGIGGMQLYKAEVPGPFKDEKLTPRLRHTARILWTTYLGISAACALAYWLAGMSIFDAIAHSMSTVSTGGFSTYNASIGHFNSPAIEFITIIFMLAGAINFSVHFIAIANRRPFAYFENIEVRTFLIFVAAVIILISFKLYLSHSYASLLHAIRDSAFEVVSVITSTGYGTADFAHWPSFLPVLLIFISFIGGCGGSTAGGIKVMRVMILSVLGVREIRKLVHPHAIISIKIGGQTLPDRTIETVWGFLAIYVICFVILMLTMMEAGLDQVSAFSAVATCMNNLGPGLGEISLSFASVSDPGKLVAVAAMLLGRLEIFTLLVLLTPWYWKQ